MELLSIDLARARQADLVTKAEHDRCCGRDQLLRQRRRDVLRTVLGR
jgi:hypothetical protein